MGTARVTFSWADIAPGPGAPLNWSATDALVGEAARHGIEIRPSLYVTPPWVAQTLERQNCSSRCGIVAPRSEAALSAWATFVSAAVARYGATGQFWAENPHLPRIPITAWQVWNEQNSATFFGPRPSVGGYARLLSTAAAAIRTHDPGAEIVLGGMAELSGVKQAIPASTYLRRLYAHKGVKADFDGVAVHPYAARLSKVRGQVSLLRRVMRRSGDARSGLYITEIGWGSGGSASPLAVGPRRQAVRLRQTLRYFTAGRRALHLKAINWYSWVDTSVPVCDWCPESGLFGGGLVEKPAWRAFVRFTGGS